MSEKYLEKVYNQLSYHIKSDVNFPDAYIFLTNEQQRFIIEMFETEREAVKEALIDSINEMKELVDEI